MLEIDTEVLSTTTLAANGSSLFCEVQDKNALFAFVRNANSSSSPLLLFSSSLLRRPPKSPKQPSMIGTSIGIALLSTYCRHPATSPFWPILLIAALSCSLKLFLVSSHCLLVSLILIIRRSRTCPDLDSLNPVSRSFVDSPSVQSSLSCSPIPDLPLSSPSPKQS